MTIRERTRVPDDGRASVDDIRIGYWHDLQTDMTYRAAYIGECVLTGPEHASLSDNDLIAEAVIELRRGNALRES